MSDRSPSRRPSAVCFLWCWCRIAPPGRYPASLPLESGLSSRRACPTSEHPCPPSAPLQYKIDSTMIQGLVGRISSLVFRAIPHKAHRAKSHISSSVRPISLMFLLLSAGVVCDDERDGCSSARAILALDFLFSSVIKQPRPMRITGPVSGKSAAAQITPRCANGKED